MPRLRGEAVDREILISYETLLKWDLIHSSFGQVTVTDYCIRNSTNYNRNLKRSKIKNVSVSQLYNKSKVPQKNYWREFQLNACC